MCATPDVVMRSFGETLEGQRNLATEQEIKGAFFAAGYGATKVRKWWEQYTHIKFIIPVSQAGFPLKNSKGEQLYTSVFWPAPLVVE